MTSIAQNLKTLKGEIEKICSGYARPAESVNLIAVSKKQPAERLQAALDAGQRVFGENRVQEAYEHWQELKPKHADLELHLIGPLQSNKTKDAVKLFDCIHTVDREKIAKALAEEMQKQDRHLPCFIQVNTGDETQKSGINPDDLPNFLRFCRKECGLNIIGLMCIPPIDEPPALHFALLQKIALENDLQNLSMGMSSDFDKAIPLGATHIRVGTGVFGARKI